MRKPRLLGQLGTVPGLNLVYAHLDPRHARARAACDLHHRAWPRRAERTSRTPISESNSREIYPDIAQAPPACESSSGSSPSPAGSRAMRLPKRGLDPRGRRAGLRPLARIRGGVRQPGSARGLARRRRRSKTGPFAASWHSNKFLNPRVDGAVLRCLHLNGYKIANPTVLARIPEDELLNSFAVTAGSRCSSREASMARNRRECTNGSRPR